MLPAKYPDYNTIDAKLWRNVFKNVLLALYFQNIADVKYTDSKGQFAPGRFKTGEIKIKF